MYSYAYDKRTGGILLNSSPTGFSKEPRPVYSPELDGLGFDRYWNYDKQTERPYMWAEANNYYYRGTLVAKLKGGNIYVAPEIIIPSGEDGEPIMPEPKGISLRPINIEAMVEANREMLEIIEQTTVKKILAIYTKYKDRLENHPLPTACLPCLQARTAKKVCVSISVPLRAARLWNSPRQLARRITSLLTFAACSE